MMVGKSQSMLKIIVSFILISTFSFSGQANTCAAIFTGRALTKTIKSDPFQFWNTLYERYVEKKESKQGDPYEFIVPEFQEVLSEMRSRLNVSKDKYNKPGKLKKEWDRHHDIL